MNIQKLFEKQKQLDLRIEKQHPRQEGEDRLAKKILALLVELGELANCWRGFKYWSYNQKPKTEELGECPLCDGTGELELDLGCDEDWFECGGCGGTGKVVVKNPLLEEYVDGLHFLLSIGLDENVGVLDEVDISKSDDLTSQFLELYNAISNLLYAVSEYPYIFGLYLGLGEMLGFTWEEIEEAYRQKNRENFRRQDSGY